MDNDLKFLSKCKSSDLAILCECLTKPLSEGLSKKESYKRYYPNKLDKMVDDIATELQLFGGHTLANGLRSILGKDPIPYREVLCDVCDILKIKYNGSDSVAKIEKFFVKKLFEHSFYNMSSGDRENWLKGHGVIGSLDITNVIQELGLPFVSLMVSQGALLSVGINGHNFIMNAFFRPINNLLTGIFAIGGPNYKVTIPCVAQIATMRMSMDGDLQKKAKKNGIDKSYPILGVEKSGKKMLELALFRPYKTKEGKYVNVATHVFSGNIKEHTDWENVLTGNNCIYFVFDFYKYCNDDIYKKISDEQIWHFFKKAEEKEFNYSKLITIASHYDSFPEPRPDKMNVRKELNDCNVDYSKIMCNNLYLVNLSDTDKVQEMIQNEIINNNIL